MIFDKLENKDCYANGYPLFKEAFAYIEEYVKNPVAPGTYEICGRDLYVVVQESTTRAEALFETHEKYIDIQFMADGAEKIVYANKEELEADTEYDESKDVQFFRDGKYDVDMVLKSGEFAVFFPQDAHKPAMDLDGRSTNKKLVVKVKVVS